jgi:transketolase C-terminal domain/subunit
MTSTCDVYKNGIKLGSGTCAGGSATISSYDDFNAGEANDIDRIAHRRNVQIVVTEAGVYTGKTWNTHVITEAATTLTLKDACPFADA